MSDWLLRGSFLLAGLLLATGLFFFATTRGTLLLRRLASATSDPRAHIYPLYSNMRLIRLVDFQPLISAILLFQYHRLVDRIVDELGSMDLRGRAVLITSCAFGNVIPRVVAAALDGGAARVLVSDLVGNELLHARSKLAAFADRVEFIEDDATAMHLADASVAANVIFFLLHELPHPLKLKALEEAGRTLAPGGRLLLAEFHRPRNAVLRALSWTYFQVFEPLGLALWGSHDPLHCLERMGGWRCTRSTCLQDNFQLISATRLTAAA